MVRQSFVQVFFTEALIFPNIQTLCSSRTSKIRYIILLSNDYNDVPHAITTLYIVALYTLVKLYLGHVKKNKWFASLRFPFPRETFFYLA